MRQPHRFPDVSVFRRVDGGRGWRSAMLTEMFLNAFGRYASVRLCPFKNHFVSRSARSGLNLVEKQAEDFKTAKSNRTCIDSGSNCNQIVDLNSASSSEVATDGTTVPIPVDLKPSFRLANQGVRSRVLIVTKLTRGQTSEQCVQDNVFGSTLRAFVSFHRKRHSPPTDLHQASLALPAHDLGQCSPSVIAELEQVFGFRFFADAQSATVDLQNPYPFASSMVTVGPKYVKEYLLDSGSGVYLEQHEMPHIHRPMNSNAAGWMLLAEKQISPSASLSVPFCHSSSSDLEESGKQEPGRSRPDLPAFRCAFFRIPNGACFYTAPLTWHADCFLTGQWEVLYSAEGQNNTLALFTLD